MTTNVVDDHIAQGHCVDTVMTPNSAGTELDLSDFLNLESFVDLPSISADARISSLPDVDASTSVNNAYCRSATPQRHGSVDIDREDASTPKPTGRNRPYFLSTVTMNRSSRFSSPFSPFSLNPRHTMLDNLPAYLFVQPPTPTISSRSPSPASSTVSTIIGSTGSPQAPNAARNESSQRECDKTLNQRVMEMEYRVRGEYLDKLHVELQLERENAEEKYRTHFEELLKDRMKEVEDEHQQQIENNRVEFEETLKERMAEVQAICNEMVEDKKEEIIRLKARLKKATTISQTTSNTRLCNKKSKKKQTGKSRVQVQRISASDSESEYVPSEREHESRSVASTPKNLESVVDSAEDIAEMIEVEDVVEVIEDNAESIECIVVEKVEKVTEKRTPDEAPHIDQISIEDLKERFFRLQLTVSIQHSQLKRAQEDLASNLKKLENCQCGTRDVDVGRIQQQPTPSHSNDLEDRLQSQAQPDSSRETTEGASDSEMSLTAMSSDRVSTPPRLFSSSPKWRPYPSPTSPSPSIQTYKSARMPTVRYREVSQTPSLLGSPFQTPPSSVKKPFSKLPPMFNGPSSSRVVDFTTSRLPRANVDCDMTSDEEQMIDELENDDDLDEPWIISG